MRRLGVAGVHDRIGAAELRHLVRRAVAGDAALHHGLLPFAGVTEAEVYRVLAERWGCAVEGSRVVIDAGASLRGAAGARARVLDVAGRGGSIAFATAAPAALLGFHVQLAALARSAGAVVMGSAVPRGLPVPGPGAARVVWVAGVAVPTDGRTLGGELGGGAAEEVLFHLGRADLVVADGALATAAVGAGIEVVAPADLDALVLGLAAARGLPVTVVPVRAGACPGAYERLLELAADGAAPHP
jgi:hypothetical protein